MPDTATESHSIWGGQTMEERRASRRAQLIEAGLDAFAGEGYPASSINRICKQASVSERYLYDEFGGKEGLLIAVYDALIHETFDAVAQALADAPLEMTEQIRRSAEAFTDTLTRDPRRARINFFEVVAAGPVVEGRRREVLDRFGALIMAQWQVLHAAGKTPCVPSQALSMALVGATQELLSAWMHHGQKEPKPNIVATLVHLYLAVMLTPSSVIHS